MIVEASDVEVHVKHRAAGPVGMTGTVHVTVEQDNGAVGPRFGSLVLAASPGETWPVVRVVGSDHVAG